VRGIGVRRLIAGGGAAPSFRIDYQSPATATPLQGSDAAGALGDHRHLWRLSVSASCLLQFVPEGVALRTPHAKIERMSDADSSAFNVFARRKADAALSARFEKFETVVDHSARFPVEAIGCPFTNALLDGPSSNR
jgi:hypothetical protein